MHSQCSRALRSCLAFFCEDAQAGVPQGSGPAAAEAQRRLRSWGSKRDLSAEVEAGTVFSLPSPDRFSASSQGWEACAAVSSAQIKAQTLQLSDSEELDAVSANAKDTEDTEVWRSWEKPVSYRVYSTQTSHYSSILNK